MLRPYVLLVVLFFSTGCSLSQYKSADMSPEIKNISPVQSTKVKIVNWCNKSYADDRDIDIVKAENGKVWVISEFSSGWYHAPTIRHVCREEKEIFYLEMKWETYKGNHVGKLISVNSSSTFNIKSTHTDPEFKLLDSKKSNQITVSVDSRIVVYDEVTNNFSK
jgi:hypothetical protein